MGISVSELLLILLIVVVVFGTKRLGGLGSDLGAAINSFRRAVKDAEPPRPSENERPPIEGEATSQHQDKS